MKRINSVTDALNTNKVQVDAGDGIVIPLPTDGVFAGGQGAPGVGVPDGGASGQVIQKTASGTRWATPSKELVGLEQVDNTPDAEKPISGPQWEVLNQKLSRYESGALSSTGDGVAVTDTSASTYATFRYTDAASHRGSIMNLHHFGRGEDGAQAYGVNIANHVGAKAAFVIHQYSSNGAMIRLDNTDVYSAIQIWNTENQSMNPGSTGTGAFLDFKPWAEDKRLRLLDSLTWLNETGKNFTFETSTAAGYGLGVRVTKDIPALFVHKNSAGAGAGVAVTNEGTSPGVDVTQNGVGLGLRITAGPANVGAYIASLRGQTFGAEASTEVDGGTALSVNKKGSGNGVALSVRNAGIGNSLQFLTGTATVARVAANGEYEHLLAGQGIVLKSPNGTRHRITVNDSGTVVATALSA